MPTYQFLNKETNEVEEYLMSYTNLSELRDKILIWNDTLHRKSTSFR